MSSARDHAAVRHAVIEWDGTLRPAWTLLGWVGHLASVQLVEPRGPSSLADLVDAGAPVEDVVAAYAALLAGRATTVVEAAAQGYAPTILGHLYPHARPLVAMLHDCGLVVTVTTDAPAEVLATVARPVGLDRVLAPTLGVERGTYTGGVDALAGSLSAKATLVAALRDQGDLLAVGVGDAATHEPVLGAATLAITVEHTPRRIEPMLRIGHRPVDVAAIRTVLSAD
ncbi:MAG TPA: haloacid dehalogenase-like hydrolase [Acidimicrobiales bacterium]|nr:haloacid dehalogenase-like hydrolase [Acidimicrobiales bacterium]